LVRRLSVSAAGRHDDVRLREELESHLRLQAAEYERAGMAPEEARRHAVLKLGSVEAVRSTYHDEQGLPFLDDVLQDVRYTIRQMRKAPLFTLTAVLSLALGIGANAAVFTIVERVLLRSLPVPRPHELVLVTDERILTQPSPRFSYPLYALVRGNDVLQGVAARFALGLNLSVNGQPARANGDLVSGNYFEVLGVSAQIGRTLQPFDDRAPGAHPVAVISDRFWRRTFSADPAVIGRQVRLNDHPFAIVGVAPRGFAGTDIGGSTDIWIPLSMQRQAGRDLFSDARTNWLEMIGRQRPGATREAATGALNRYLQQRAAEVPSPNGARALVLLPGDKGTSAGRRELGSAVLILFALTALAFALACVNVACLAAVRSAARVKEIAIRLALGARTSRLTQQLLTEGVVLAALGGVAGVLMAPWLTESLAALRAPGLEIDAALDPRSLLFAALVSLLAGVIVALVPILSARKVKFAPTTDRPWTSAGAASRRVSVHDAIVSLQIAMALSMLITAALLVQSVRSLKSVDPGFRADNLLLVSLDAAAAGYDASRIDGFWRAVLEQVGGIRGVQSVTLAATVPLGPGRQRQPWTNPTSGEKIELDTNFVGPAYFATLDIPLLSGREFDYTDGRTSQPVVIVNQRVAEMFWPRQDPIGKSVRLPGSTSVAAQVVGVVRDAKYRDLRGDTSPMFYRPVLQTRSTDAMTLHVRAAGADTLASAVRQTVHTIDRNVPLFRMTTLDAQLDASFGQTRQAALLTGSFGVLALLLSGIGVYGVTALAVSRRTRDIGIRVALGARRSHIARAIAVRAAVIVAIGLVLGVVASLAFTRVTGTLLFAITPGDTPTFVAMAGVLALVCTMAFVIPVRTAVRLDALTAIRHE
jgi:predicted permease